MNLKLNRAIRQVLLVGAATAMTAGAFSLAQAAVTPGVQIVPPGPGQVPDYFGVSSNYATSAQPNFALVTINGDGTGAVAAATTTDYLNPNYGITPAGMYTGNLMDVQLVSGGSDYTLAGTTVTVAGQAAGATTSVQLTPIIVNHVIAGFAEIPHAAALTDDNNTVYPAWAQDTGTLQWLLQTYDSNSKTWTQVGVDGVGPYWVGLGASTDANGNVVSTQNIFTQPIPGTGIRKFVNSVSLPGSTNDLGQTLSIADATVYNNPFTNADYYEIAEVAYTQQLHSDLPPTHLRGYIQLVPKGKVVNGVTAQDITTIANIQTSASTGTYYVLGAPSYLGPVIVAQKNKAVRIKAVNLLPTGPAGNLPFPVDHTYMGAGTQTNEAGATTGLLSSALPDNRTAMHLHGGTTPWISDGTPRQWFAPAGETTVSRGISATDVPDMWYVNGVLDMTVGCQGQTDPVKCAAGATNNPGAGALTFYYTNEQSARLMFYHDHAEGTTRLNVYAGMAAGYIMRDDTEQAMTAGGAAQNGVTYNQVLPVDEIPLVIQEKTFVPDNTKPVLTFYGPFRSQLNAQDPTWRWGSNGAGNPNGSWDGVTGGFVSMGQFPGTTVPSSTNTLGVTYANGPGDLWVPHVYMTNQNPGDVGGANPQGRWDYGSWFWPPATVIDHPQVQNPYYDASCTSANISNPVGTCEFQYIPGFPNGGAMPATTQAVKCTFTQGTKGGVVKTCTPAGTVSGPSLAAMSQPSGTPEAFNDTALVNGTVYPYMNVDPKKYRLRILSVGNDRAFNLSMFVATSKTVDSTAEGNTGATSKAANDAVCSGTNAGNLPADCTEVRMVPWNATQNVTSKFPSWWYTTLKGGITFDGRPGGVPDPKLRGPAMVQIGTEGGFLAEPAVIKNQPVNFEFNVKNILVTNVKEHALLLGPAERADVVVDFSQFAGSTIILYNDAPAALPAYDLRLDYFTGGFDNTDTGGTFSTVPGYGPNTRTVMQFRVASACPANTNCGTGINRGATSNNPVDDVDTAWLGKPGAPGSATGLYAEINKAFKYSQEPIVVPQAAYNNVYGTSVADAVSSNISAIGDTALTFTPFDSTLGVGVLGNTSVTLGLEPKAIQELFTLDYGRMNATLGTEIPNTTAVTQTTIPLGYVEPPTELVQMTKDDPNLVIGGNIGQLSDGTQIWKITHNGVDTHPVHFHLFSVQLLNRVGWDGAIYPPEANEIGWKEVLRMNPLSDVIVALRPKTLTLPFKLGNSHHLADATQADGSVFNQPNLDPTTGNASTVVNRVLNYGWEYVWHCHILGHEENDFMRSIAVAQVPEDPSTPLVTQANGNNLLTWTDNSVVSNWVTIQRSNDTSFDPTKLLADGVTHVTVTSFNVANPVSTGGYNAYGECLSQAGCARTWTDVAANVPAGTSYYRVIANSTAGAGDINAKLPADLDKSKILPVDSAGTSGVGFLGYDNVTANSAAAVSNSVVKLVPIASVNPASLAFGNQALQSTSVAKTVTLTNTGTAQLAISGIAFGPASNGSTFARPNGAAGGTCGATLAVSASCTINVTFRATSTGAKTGSLVITDNSNGVAGTKQTVPLTGTGINGSFANVTPVSPLTFTAAVGSNSGNQTVTISNTGNQTLSISNIALTGTGFTRNGGSCSTTFPINLTNGNSCTYVLRFSPTVVGASTGSLTFTDNSNGVVGATQVLTLNGTGTVPQAVPTLNIAGGNWNTGIGSRTFTFTNPTAGSFVTISAITMNTLLNGSQFTFSAGTCTVGTVLTSGQSCTGTINRAIRPVNTPLGNRLGSASVTITDTGATTATQTSNTLTAN